jgi:MFS family permease
MSKSWWVFCLATGTYMMAFIQRSAPGLVTDRLAAVFGVPPAAMGELAVGQFVAYAALQLPVGLVGDRFGPARWLAVGALLDGGGTMLFSQVHSFAWLVVSRGIIGLGDAMLFVNIVLLLGRWFPPTVFGRLLSVVGTSGGAAATITTVPLAWLLSVWGWRPSFLLMGGVLVGLALLAAALLPRWEREAPGHGVRVVRPADTRLVLRHVTTAIRGWIPFAMHFGLIGAYTGFVAIYAVPYLMATHHLSRVAAGGIESIAMLGSVLGGPLAGWAADRFGPARPASLVAVVALAGWVILALWPNAPLALTAVGLSLTAVAAGGAMLTFAVVKSWFPATEVGSATGLANTGGFVAAALFPLLVGRLIGHGWGVALLPGLGFSLVGLAATWVVRLLDAPRTLSATERAT